MRVGMYVYGPSTITLDRAAVITRLVASGAHTSQRVAAGKVALAVGIYRIVSAEPLTVIGSLNCDLFVSLSDSAAWPNPAVTFGRFACTFPEITYAMIQAFFPATSGGATTDEQTFRIGVYAYETSTLELDRTVVVTPFPGRDPAAERKLGPGKALLEPGIYRVVTDAPLSIQGDANCDVYVSIEGKQQIPDIAATLGRFSAVFPMVTQAQLQEFFPLLARGFDLQWSDAETTEQASSPSPRR